MFNVGSSFARSKAKIRFQVRLLTDEHVQCSFDV